MSCSWGCHVGGFLSWGRHDVCKSLDGDAAETLNTRPLSVQFCNSTLDKLGKKTLSCPRQAI